MFGEIYKIQTKSYWLKLPLGKLQALGERTKSEIIVVQEEKIFGELHHSIPRNSWRIKGMFLKIKTTE